MNTELLAKLTATYAQIDVELAAYSAKANANDRSADKHYQEADRLKAVAHGITAQLVKG
jgi:hypothetical protein